MNQCDVTSVAFFCILFILSNKWCCMHGNNNLCVQKCPYVPQPADWADRCSCRLRYWTYTDRVLKCWCWCFSALLFLVSGLWNTKRKRETWVNINKSRKYCKMNKHIVNGKRKNIILAEGSKPSPQDPQSSRVFCPTRFHQRSDPWWKVYLVGQKTRPDFSLQGLGLDTYVLKKENA